MDRPWTKPHQIRALFPGVLLGKSGVRIPHVPGLLCFYPPGWTRRGYDRRLSAEIRRMGPGGPMQRALVHVRWRMEGDCMVFSARTVGGVELGEGRTDG